MWQNSNADLLTFLYVMVISIVSGFISIAQRITRGASVTVLWLLSEFAAALLLGYLMWDAYPKIANLLPDWFTAPIAVATAAHFGGRGLQGLEALLYRHLVHKPPKPPESYRE